VRDFKHFYFQLHNFSKIKSNFFDSVAVEVGFLLEAKMYLWVDTPPDSLHTVMCWYGRAANPAKWDIAGEYWWL